MHERYMTYASHEIVSQTATAANGNVFSFEAIVQYFVCITSIGFLFL